MKRMGLWHKGIGLALLLGLCLPGIGLSAETPVGQSSQHSVILVSWDGAGMSLVQELLKSNSLPNLAALIKDGSLQEIEVVGHTTCTKPGHAQMLTGLDPETTGIFNNSKYRPVPEGYTIFERVQKLLGKDGIATILVSAKTDNVGSRTPEEIAKSKKGVKADAVVGDPYSLTKKTLDVCDTTDRLAAETGTVFLKYLEQYKTRRFLAFVHFADPDKMGHKYGSASKEYRQGAIDCDAELGKIVEWLKKEKRYDTTRIYVTADHGFDVNAKSHTNAPHISLATNDKQVTHGGTQADIPTTILQGFGVDLEKLNPKVIGKPLTAAVAK